MISFLQGIPIFGSYTLILATFVLLFVLKLFILQSDKKENKQIESNKETTELIQSTNKIIQPKKKKCGGKKNLCTKKIKLKNNVLHIYYASHSNVSKKLLGILIENLEGSNFKHDITDLTVKFNLEEKLPLHQDGATIFILNNEDTIKWCEDWLHSSSINPKMEKNFLKEIKFAVFNCCGGDDDVAHKWDKYLWKLGGRRLKKVNTNVVSEKSVGEAFEEWKNDLMIIVQGTPKKKACACGPKKKKGAGDGDSHSDGSSSCDSSSGEPGGVVDVEDLLLAS